MAWYTHNMSTYISVKTTVLEDILQTLKTLQREVREVKKKLSDAPPYGSDEWWEWIQGESEKDFENGDYFVLKTGEEIDDFMSNIQEDSSNEKYRHKNLRKS